MFELWDESTEQLEYSLSILYAEIVDSGFALIMINYYRIEISSS